MAIQQPNRDRCVKNGVLSTRPSNGLPSIHGQRHTSRSLVSARVDDCIYGTIHELFSIMNTVQTSNPAPIQLGSHYALNANDQLNLMQLVELWETTRAIKSMKPYKSPGLDGFQLPFFPEYWAIVGPTVHKLVVQAFKTGNFDGDNNNTLLILILKVDQPEDIKQFRPISLCNVVYKTIYY